MNFFMVAAQSLDGLLNTFELDVAKLTQIGARVLGIWALAWLSVRAVGLIARRIVKAVDDGDDSRLSLREKRGQTVAQLIRSVGKVAIYGIAMLLTLDIFIDIGPLLAGAGVAGLAISFGAQSLVKDFLSGFFILFEDQFTVGDVVELGGKSGVVERMTLRAVMIRDIDGNLHVVPNGAIDVVSNKTRGWARTVIEVGIAYEADVDQALAVFRDEAEQFGRDPEWTARLDGMPEVWGVERLDDSAVVIRTVIRTRPGEQWGAGREYRRRIKNRLDREGIEIPFPQRTLHVRPAGARLE